jgi:hypothetical protein
MRRTLCSRPLLTRVRFRHESRQTPGHMRKSLDVIRVDYYVCVCRAHIADIDILRCGHSELKIALAPRQSLPLISSYYDADGAVKFYDSFRKCKGYLH